MRGGLSAVLEKGVIGVCLREVLLVGVGEVDVVEGEGCYGEVVGGIAQHIVQRGYLCLLTTSITNLVRECKRNVRGLSCLLLVHHSTPRTMAGLGPGWMHSALGGLLRGRGGKGYSVEICRR